MPEPATSSRADAPGDRQCSRTACSAPAASTLTYEYGRSQVWLDELTAARDPHGYDLCATHTARLTLPLGWHLLDRRPAARRALLAS